MSPEEFKTHATKLHDFYGKKPTGEAMKFWFAEVGKLPGHVMEQAVIDTCLHERFMPTLAEFKKRMYNRNERAKGRAGAESQIPPDPVLTLGEQKFNAKIFPLWNAFLEGANRLGEETRNREFAKFMIDFHGYAVHCGVHGLIDWPDFEGQFGFKVPAAWSRSQSTTGQARPDVRGELA